MAYTITEAFANVLPISSFDSGYLPPSTVSSGSTTAIPSPPLYPGMIVRAQDPTLGMGEFILLAGVASTIVGSLVRYNSASFATVLAVNTAVQAMPVAVAMSANIVGTTWGWYQISGSAKLAKTAVIILPNVAVYISATAGQVKALASAGLQVVACRSQLLTTASASATVLVTIHRPHLQSQVT
jgi:hypothetical protein